MKYEAVIGIEIHCELKTKTKMFSGAPLGYGQEPNTAINEIDLSMPGTLPQLNRFAVEQAIKLSKVLNCDIDTLVRFDRKNYFYSDLPKGYQITQQFHPLGSHGNIDILVGDDVKNIRINRLHMEEDTAKQFHEDDKTRIDFNRAGTPLIEIVTEADFRTGEQAAAYVEALRLIVVELGISDGKMEEGSMRCDVNISIRPIGQEAFGTKVEIKNLNSINNIQKSIEFEMKRQIELVENGDKVISQTRRFDEKSQETVAMRTKETAVDYRYFVEPNIPPIRIPDSMLDITIPELPLERILRLQKDHKLGSYDASVLGKNRDLVEYFDTIMEAKVDAKLVVNWLTQDLQSALDQKGERSFAQWIQVPHFVSFIQSLSDGVINSKQAKTVFQKMLEGKDPVQTIKDEGMVQISDENVLSEMIESVLEANPQVIEDYRKGLDKSIKFVVGQVMKVSKGQANPRLTNRLVVSLLDKKL